MPKTTTLNEAIALLETPNKLRERLKRELKSVGVSRYGLLKLETRYLPNIIHHDEHICGVVYGRHNQGSVMLLATDHRIIFLDKKPFFVNEDEITYDVVSGVSFSHAGWSSTVTLHTRIKDYVIRTLNKWSAQVFVKYIEDHCLEENYLRKESNYDYTEQKWPL